MSSGLASTGEAIPSSVGLGIAGGLKFRPAPASGILAMAVGSQSLGYQQEEQKISGVLDLFFCPVVGHFCVITPGH